MNEEEFSSESSDDDYIPEGEVSASEEDESGEDEILLNNDGNVSEDKSENLKRSNMRIKARKRKRSRPNEPEPIINENQNECFDVPNKVKTDILWEDFLKDTSAARPKSKANVETIKVKVIKEYNFAGETIKVEDEIDINPKVVNTSSVSIPNVSVTSNCKDNASAFMKNSTIELIPNTNNVPNISTKPNILPSLNAQSQKKVGGLSSVLEKINKKPKINILEKSKLDWQSFTKAEGIQEDLKKHNIGKQGYLERMSFLQRTDQKQFEIERNFRLSNKKPS